MRNIRKLVSATLLGMALTLSATVLAQTPAGNTQTQESCCAMPDCCCNGGSCPMKKEAKNHRKARSANDKDGCCCHGDACDMKMKEKQDSQAKNKG